MSKFDVKTLTFGTLIVNLPKHMVNEKSGKSTRSRIIEILGTVSTGISGEKIASQLSISRVAVWKGIQSLKENGYIITTSSSGYMLKSSPKNSIFPWEFGNQEQRFKHWEHTDSTMNRAREAALEGAGPGMVLTAHHQSEGRGTGEKKWESPDGGLFFTLITRPNYNASYAHLQILTAQLALLHSLKKLSNIPVTALWPNDIFVDNAKAGGILAETLCSGHSISFQNLGIGINTGVMPSIKDAASIQVNKKELLGMFLTEFEKMNTSSFSPVTEWNALCPNFEKKIIYKHAVQPHDQTPAPVLEGFCRGVDQYGWLLLDESRYPPGSITLINKGNKK